ncbi:MAG: hypothetical protein ACJ79H_16185 [Myxococcales bacterium]
MPACGLRLAACGLLVLGCTPDFQSASQVTDLRVLAIRQEAVEEDGSSQFADASVDPAAHTAQPVRVRALVADGHPQKPLVAHARVCSPTDSGRCDDVPTFDLEPPFSSPEAAIEQQPVYDLQVPPEVVALALQDDRLKGFGGIRVQLSLEASDGDPHGPAMASKILLYTTAPDTMRNHNPEVVGLAITREGTHVQTVASGGTIAVTPGIEYGLRPLLGPGGSGVEDYDVVDLTGQTIHLRETPRYSFFSTDPIGFDRDEADEPLAGQPQPVNGIARFTAGAGTGSMWVVARDGRGGIGWISVRCAAGSP